jgi:sugar lactone lactonase YvrE
MPAHGGCAKKRVEMSLDPAGKSACATGLPAVANTVVLLRYFATLALAAALAPLAFASGTATWEMNSYADFIRGRFSGISLSRDGRLSLAPKVDPVFASDQPAIWSIARAPDGTLYAATGNRGRVYKIDGAGKASLLWTAEQPEVFAIAVDRKGVVYAATSPDGAVYRIADGKATEYFAPKSRYIWSLAVGPDGALYVGTGDQGKIFRVDSAGKGELYYDTGQSHITGLAVDAQGRLLAGTEPNGILYRISAKDKAFVLYDSGLPEIRAIVPMPDGTVYAAALGGSVARRAQAAGQGTQNATPAGTVPTVTATVTVEAQRSEIKPPDATKPQTQRAAPVPASQTPAQTTPLPDVSGAEKSAVYRINPDNTVETLWSSKEENAYDLLALEEQVLFATDQNGRIYGLTPDRRVTLVTETGEGETTRLLSSGNSVLAATSDIGRIFRLGEAPGAAGELEAPVHDAGAVSRWGSVSWRAEAPAGCSVAFRTRTGNSAKPDQTWSDWSAPLTDPAGSRIPSPNARYIQWKMEMAGSGGATPVLHGVTVAYLPQNSPPVVTSINVSTQAAAPAQSTKPSSDASSVTVSASADPSSAASAGLSTQVLSHSSNSQITVAWQAEDPDGDRLVYDVSFRGEDQTQWIPLKSGTHDNSISFDDDMFADGKYFFRVVASDRESNPPSSAREAQSISAAVLIDNTPPVATLGAVRRDGATAHIEFEAADQTSPLRHCEYSVDASGWVPIEAADGIVDGLREKFTLDLKGLAPGEHLLVIRVADSAGNTGVAKVVLK